jgi:hypothetical protein
MKRQVCRLLLRMNLCFKDTRLPCAVNSLKRRAYECISALHTLSMQHGPLLDDMTPSSVPTTPHLVLSVAGMLVRAVCQRIWCMQSIARNYRERCIVISLGGLCAMQVQEASHLWALCPCRTPRRTEVRNMSYSCTIASRVGAVCNDFSIAHKGLFHQGQLVARSILPAMQRCNKAWAQRCPTSTCLTLC